MTLGYKTCTLSVMPDENVCFQCNRPARPHCPECGSLRRYGFAKVDSVTRPDGTIAHLRVYRCLTCARVYNDDDWMLRCQAQPQSVGRPPSTARTRNATLEQVDAIKEKGLEQAPPDLVARIMEYKKRGY